MKVIKLLLIFIIIITGTLVFSKLVFSSESSEISKDEARKIVQEYIKYNNPVKEEIIIDDIDDILLNGEKAYGFNPRVVIDTHTSSLGFFYVTISGKLYEMDILNPNNFIEIK